MGYPLIGFTIATAAGDAFDLYAAQYQSWVDFALSVLTATAGLLLLVALAAFVVKRL